MKQYKNENEAGYTALETIVCLAVLIQILILGAHYMQKSSEKLVQNNAAAHLNNVNRAAVYYLQDNMDIIAKKIKSNDKKVNSMVIELSELKDKGYLPTNFPSKNIYNQSVEAKVFLLKPDNYEDDDDQIRRLSVFQLLVFTTDGKILDLAELRNISSFIGGDGGYVYNDDGTLTGTFNSWSLDISDIEELNSGHNAVLTYINETDILQASTFLRRVKILDKTKYNVMDTNLGINDEFVLQFISKGDDKIDPENDEITTIKSKEIRLSKNVYFNDKELVIGNDNDTNKIILSSEGLKVIGGGGDPDIVNIKPSSISLYTESELTDESLIDQEPRELIKGNNNCIFNKITKDETKLVHFSNDNRFYSHRTPDAIKVVMSNPGGLDSYLSTSEIKGDHHSVFIENKIYDGNIHEFFNVTYNNLELANSNGDYICLCSTNSSFNGYNFQVNFSKLPAYSPYSSMNDYSCIISQNAGNNFYGISFYPNNERMDLYSNGRYIVFGLTTESPYYNEGAAYTGKPPRYDDGDYMNFVSYDTPYLYLSNTRDNGNEKEVLFTPHRVQYSEWHQVHSEDRWYKLLTKQRGDKP